MIIQTKGFGFLHLLNRCYDRQSTTWDSIVTIVYRTRRTTSKVAEMYYLP